MEPYKTNHNPSWLRRRATLLLWAVFAAGLLAQAFAPRLKIEKRAFVIPPSMAASGNVRPDEIVSRERRMQLLSGILTLAGAAGLAVRYRRVLAGRRPA